MNFKNFIMPEQKTISRRGVIIARIVIGLLIIVWLLGAFYLYSEVREADKKIVQIQQKAQQDKERLRREATYRRVAMEQQAVQSGVQNAVDALKQ